ncbi:MAG TPA: transcription elongation factor GreA [Candidatus Limnocylindrales bacterium]|nr:transcription elongation factor GreA [Candidatus Limnocylindrales bacterium]
MFVIELGTPLPTAPLDLARVGKWIERVPDLRLDGERPSSRALLARLAAFWLPGEPILFIGSTAGSVGARVGSIARTALGERRPSASAHWIHALRTTDDLRVWWARTDAHEEYEDALLTAFGAGLGPAAVAALPDTRVILPWANLRTPTGERKATGITSPVLPGTPEPAPPPVTTIVDLPAGEADGARDEAARRARPARGRGTGRVASAAAYAAQGSPRVASEPVYLSPQGRERLEAELEELRTVVRPQVIARIAAARELGDLRENSEYHAAREEQSFLEGRIRSIEMRLRSAVVIDPETRGTVADLGSTVRVEVDGEERRLTIVGSAEADLGAGRISNVSPVGRALLGRRAGDVVTIRTPSGEIRYAVLAIE